MLQTRGSVLQRVEGINELIQKEFRERRSYERTILPISLERLKGKVIIQEEDQAKAKERKTREGLILWTDQSRREDEQVGCAVVWERNGGWEQSWIHLSQRKKAFDTEVYALSEAIHIA